MSHLGRQAFDPKLGEHGDGEDERRYEHAVFGLKEPVVVETGLALQCRQNDANATNPAGINAAVIMETEVNNAENAAGGLVWLVEHREERNIILSPLHHSVDPHEAALHLAEWTRPLQTTAFLGRLQSFPPDTGFPRAPPAASSSSTARGNK